MKCFISFLLLFAAITAKAQQYKIGRDGELITEKQVSFKENTAELLPESTEVLAYIKKYLDDRSYISLLRIEANVTASGESRKDDLLATQRATAVYTKLISMGVDCKRLIAVSFGSNKPVAETNSPEGKAANSYIKIFNVAIHGRIIGGMEPNGGGDEIKTSCKRDNGDI